MTDTAFPFRVTIAGSAKSAFTLKIYQAYAMAQIFWGNPLGSIGGRINSSNSNGPRTVPKPRRGAMFIVTPTHLLRLLFFSGAADNSPSISVNLFRRAAEKQKEG